MNLSSKEYSEKYCGGVHRTTVVRRAQKGLLPSNHIAKKIGGNWVFEIGEMEHLKDFDVILKRKSKP